MELLFNMIFKQKSFHVFKNLDHLRQEELQEIENYFKQLQPLKGTVNQIKALPNSYGLPPVHAIHSRGLWRVKVINYLFIE